MARHMFFGGNTPNGFYNCFNNILFLDEAQKIIYLKGSSGSGKSTLMRKIGEIFENKGMQADYIHCSNNVSDLDGVCIRELGICIVDGTAPHVCDPVVPIAIDEIFNTADYIDREYIAGHAKNLMSLQSQKKQYYDKAYNYLNAAYQIYLNNSYIYRQSLNKVKLQKAIEEELLVFREMNSTETQGRERKFFASAITPQGKISFIDTLLKDKKIIALHGKDGMGTDFMLERLKNAAIEKGLHTECCYCSLNVNKLEHLLIPSMELCYTTVNEYHPISMKPDRIICFDEFLNQSFVEEHTEELSYNAKMFEELLQHSMDMMLSQKNIHDQIENIYVAGMDFEEMNHAFEHVMDRLLKLNPVHPDR